MKNKVNYDGDWMYCPPCSLTYSTDFFSSYSLFLNVSCSNTYLEIPTTTVFYMVKTACITELLKNYHSKLELYAIKMTIKMIISEMLTSGV